MKSKDLFYSEVSEADISRERRKARDLRRTQWWKRKKSDGVCRLCGRQVPPRELTMDHIVPLVRGGKSLRNNVIPVCKECNSRKKYLLLMEWENDSGETGRD